MLRPWVVASPPGFPELLTRSFVFTDVLQLGTPVLDVLCRNMDTLMAAKNTMAIESQILTALNNRGISKPSVFVSVPVPLGHHLRGILSNPLPSENAKKSSIERNLRMVAFEHRKEFPELKSSRLVKSWERRTGMRW
ncbi:hypothetical protein IQ06DRAFT_5846 [Phaeosphaeriaceae sp. SRC1lsM3a]|nr:hypothetical protein IQ06DRAFT_5846 [Stagonospora sp. SRC1lsM3a]